MAVKDFDRVADIYDATRSLPEREMSLLVEALRKHVAGPGPLLDMGVGTGRFALPLQQMGVDVVGVDVSRAMVARARTKGVGGLVFADVRRTPFRDRSFEAALLVHVLHLVGDWARVIEEAARVARVNVISVVESRSGTSVREEYLRLRNRMGYPLARFGEWSLSRRVKPLAVSLVAEFQTTMEADREIEHLLKRGQSLTWDVPESAHAEIIGALRSRHGGKRLRAKESVRLIVWSADRLREADLRHK